jgi:hypothetical protein
LRYFYADSLDTVDPTFDFTTEESSATRIPQRDDIYAHELFGTDRPYDGILVSKFLLDGKTTQGRYSQPQRQRFFREGAQRFLRFPLTGEFDPERYPILGDCGAFNYHMEEVPPFSVDEVIDFYDLCGFTHGIAVDHMILAYHTHYDRGLLPVPEEFRRRADLTLTLADEFLRKATSGAHRFQPIGVAQGWSPKSYQDAVKGLLKIGFDYIALGGMVPLKTPEITEVLAAVRDVTQSKVRLHLLGITRLENYDTFARSGVVSLDSTSPLRQGVKEGIYYGDGGPYLTIRIPQTDVNPRVLKQIRSGAFGQEELVAMERRCLEVVAACGRGEAGPDEVLQELKTYEACFEGKSKWSEVRRTLVERPWEKCRCAVCASIGINAVVFRGANRNRRRGFHNLWYTHRQLTALRSESQEGVKR